MQSKYDRCPNCMQSLQGNEDTCTYCGFEISKYEEKPNCLRPFTVLQNKYMIGRVIGVGGFGITYIGWDLNLQTYIAIKEYFPESIASRDTSVSPDAVQVIPNETKKEIYDKGLKRYVEEAQNLSKFYQLQGIVSVKDFFYENGTGYIVMEYINGINLKEYLNNMGGKLDENTVLALMKPVFESLYQMHNAGLVHRDISPDNIMVDQDGKIKLIDFGSARGQSAETDKTYTVILKHGYAPSEQYYAKGNQGPWTDIYSLCATMYKMLTGQIPPNSVERMENDEYVAPSAYGVQISPRTEAVLQRGLAVKVNDRYQNIGQLLNDLYGTQPIAPMAATVPIAAGASFANPTSFSQQSMHLNVEDTSKASEKTKKNRMAAYIAIGAIVIAVIVAVVLFVTGGKDDKDDKDPTTTEQASTTDGTTEEDGTTEATTEGTSEEPAVEPTNGYTYEWPTELSDNWRDYTISIDGTVYQFPMPYSEWKSKGWKTNSLPTNLAAGEGDYTEFYNDRLELTAAFMNPGLSETAIEDCWVVGVSIDTEYDEVADGVVIELPGGVKLLESSEDDIKKAFGAPEYRYEGTDYEDKPYVSLDYAGDTYEDGMDFEINADGKLASIAIANTAIPANAVGNTDISTEPPVINSYYTEPSGPSTDRFDSIITLDGVNYQLPVPVAQLTQNGWILDTATDDYISGNSNIDTYLEKDGSKIYVQLDNFTPNAILPVNAYITSIQAESNYCTLEIIFPGGVKLGSSGTELENLYGDLGEDFEKDEWTSSISYSIYKFAEDSADGFISIYAYEDIETGLIYKYTYSNNVEEIKE